MTDTNATITGHDVPAMACHLIRLTEDSDLRAEIGALLPGGPYRKICIKPNWVMHQQYPEFPIQAMVTGATLVDAVIACCLDRYPSLEEITIGDAPLQTCDWDLMVQQAGLATIIAKYTAIRKPRIFFQDWRRERAIFRQGVFHRLRQGPFGDPKGYAEVTLNEASYLDPVSSENRQFRVMDYDPLETTRCHGAGFHHYLIANSALDCDLFINLPKMKTHRLAGITGALKNAVGIVGNKACLVHYRRGSRDRKGDEFPDPARFPLILHARVREFLQRRPAWLARPVYFPLRASWTALRKIHGIETIGKRENLPRDFFTGGGGWYGNDSVWRMIYDLNHILLYARPSDGALEKFRQRDTLIIMDGLVAGEGNGPLQALPVPSNILLASSNPCLVDLAAAKLMGFDWGKIPQLARIPGFKTEHWNEIDPYRFHTIENGRHSRNGLEGIPVFKHFLPAPGWKGNIELPASGGMGDR